MQIHLKTLGCRLNEAELEAWAEEFKARGHTLAKNADSADLLIINTCAVTQEAVKKSRQIIRRTHRQNPKAKLLVSGCYTSLNKQLGNDIPGIDLLVDNQEKDKLVEIALKSLSVESMPDISSNPGETSIFERGRNRAFIKIQDGCRHRCTFCIVTVARGDERSLNKDKIIENINYLHRQGVQEVVLTGVHVGGYGSDINSNLQELIKYILQESDIPRIRLASIEPWELSDDFFELFSNKRLMPHMHLPLQSGSDTILRKMARRCKTKEFKNLIIDARKKVPNFNVSTDIITGFPGEGEKEWQESINFIEEIGFSHIHIFTYSKRAGTKAASLADQVDPIIKKNRSKQLHELSSLMQQSFLTKQTGKNYKVLWETLSPKGIWTGYTENFIRVELDGYKSNKLENQISEVKVTGINHKGDRCLVDVICP